MKTWQYLGLCVGVVGSALSIACLVQTFEKGLGPLVEIFFLLLTNVLIALTVSLWHDVRIASFMTRHSIYEEWMLLGELRGALWRVWRTRESVARNMCGYCSNPTVERARQQIIGSLDEGYHAGREYYMERMDQLMEQRFAGTQIPPHWRPEDPPVPTQDYTCVA